MRYFLPDSQDLVDPSFDFDRERRNPLRIRQRDDLYAHELFRERAYDGILVSKGIVDGFGEQSGRYSISQRHRLLRCGVREFFRLDRVPYALPVMGDCGAFTYINEPEPPYSVEDVITFYEDCGFDLGISVDHVILAFEPKWDLPGQKAPSEVRARQELTLTLAAAFLRASKKRKCRFEPLGVAQGWSPRSYAHSVAKLQKMGYPYIAVGGMVPLKTPEILACLAGIAEVRKPSTRLHLLGVTRTEAIPAFARLGVASFDSTSPLRQAFKDASDNYYTLDRTYTAVRVPQVDANPALSRKISSGKLSQELAIKHERQALQALRDFGRRKATAEEAVDAVVAYELISQPDQKVAASGPNKGLSRLDQHRAAYLETLEDRPWAKCGCEICKALGYHVLLFRGAERNRRRGLHNVWTFYRRLQREVAGQAGAAA